MYTYVFINDQMKERSESPYNQVIGSVIEREIININNVSRIEVKIYIDGE